MSDIDKAITILQKTNDGNKLSPGHLSLVEFAVNGRLTDAGSKAFEKLYGDVTNGLYAKPWLHGIEHLTKGHDGYVKWKDAVIEHYSFSDSTAEREAAIALAASCRSLEDRGFPVCWRTVGKCTPFEDAPAGTPWVRAMLSYYTMFAENNRCKWLVLNLSGENAVAVSVTDAKIDLRHAIGTEVDHGCYLMFHLLQGEGMKSAGRRLDTYAGFVEAMYEAGITPEAVDVALNAQMPGHPENH